jgi:hypothetical protein
MQGDGRQRSETRSFDFRARHRQPCSGMVDPSFANGREAAALNRLQAVVDF